MNRKQTLRSTTAISRRGWTPSELKIGRRLRNPEGEHEGGQGGGTPTPTPAPNNEGGNTGAEDKSTQNQNNTGTDEALASFWAPPTPDAQTPPVNSGSAGTTESGGGTQQPSPVAVELAQHLEGMKFDAVMTPEILEAFTSGKVEDFNTGLQKFGQGVAKQTIGAMVGVMRHLRDEIMAEVDSRTDSKFTADKQHAALIAAIPAASNPVAGKTIRDIYDQALIRSKGDTKVAVQQTRDVMRLQVEHFGGDLGLEVAPNNPGGDRPYTPPKINWLEELAGR